MNLTATAYEAILRSNPDLRGPSLPKPPRGAAPTEHEEQAAVIAWARENEALLPALRLLYAIPNGGKRDARTAKMLEAEGVRAGVPDLCLPMQRNGHGALYIEMKRRDYSNRLSGQQNAYVRLLRAAGNLVVVCYGAPEAIRTLLVYLED